MLSTSTILILSGFLLGMSVAHPLGDLSFYIFTCGLTGLVAYLTFEMTGLRNERTMIRHDQRLMEARLLRHVGLSLQQSSHEHHEKDRLLDWLRRETEALSRS
ncbi:hypothetical protein SH661x_004528 [Planctomicrobium sp. SH661]|uniref:hypothetical protein n=1 Tax=Planctomicrobium sp. SH661 TaxID=3448124 RepID=UPI003F5C411C